MRGRDAKRHFQRFRVDQVSQPFVEIHGAARDKGHIAQGARKLGGDHRIVEATLGLGQRDFGAAQAGRGLIHAPLGLGHGLTAGQDHLTGLRGGQFGQLDGGGGTDAAGLEIALTLKGAVAQRGLIARRTQLVPGEDEIAVGLAGFGFGIHQVAERPVIGRLRIRRVDPEQDLPGLDRAAIPEAGIEKDHRSFRLGAHLERPSAAHLAIGGQDGRDCLHLCAGHVDGKDALAPFGDARLVRQSCLYRLHHALARECQNSGGQAEQEQTDQAVAQKSHVIRTLGGAVPALPASYLVQKHGTCRV